MELAQMRCGYLNPLAYINLEKTFHCLKELLSSNHILDLNHLHIVP